MSEDRKRARLDKWLWAARFYKTRSQSADAIKNGRVMIRGERAKPGQPVGVGSEMEVRKGPYTFELKVIGLAERRGNAELARSLYTEAEESVRRRQEVYEHLSQSRPKNAGARMGARPTKKQRRALMAFKDSYRSPEDIDEAEDGGSENNSEGDDESDDLDYEWHDEGDNY